MAWQLVIGVTEDPLVEEAVNFAVGDKTHKADSDQPAARYVDGLRVFSPESCARL